MTKSHRGKFQTIQTSYLLEIDNTQQRIKLVINPSACLAFPSESILAWHKSLKHFPYISRRITILYLLALLPLKPAAQAESAARLMRRARFSIAIIRLIYWYGTWNSHLIVFDYTKFIFVGGEKHVSRWRRWVWWIGCDVTAHTFLPSYFIRLARFISRSQHCLRFQSETINAEVESIGGRALRTRYNWSETSSALTWLHSVHYASLASTVIEGFEEMTDD